MIHGMDSCHVGLGPGCRSGPWREFWAGDGGLCPRGQSHSCDGPLGHGMVVWTMNGSLGPENSTGVRVQSLAPEWTSGHWPEGIGPECRSEPQIRSGSWSEAWAPDRGLGF